MATVRIQLRRGEYQDWYDANPQLAAGELAIETDTNRIKIGDGSTNWRDLDYAIVNNDGTPLTTDDYGQPDGVPQLDGSGYIKSENLPPLAKITVHSVANQAARLALTVEPGDIAIQSDTGTSYVLQSTPASTNANWKELTATQAINDAVNAAVNSLLDGAPGALNTLNELAAAIGDDPAFFTTIATNLSNHEADTTNVHGIANTADLATKAYADQAEADAISTASADATSKANAAQAAAEATASGALSSHEADTTNVHGIADTTILVTTTGNQTLTSKSLTSPSLTGTPTAPTAANGTDTTQIATTEFVQNAIEIVVGAAPDALNTLSEIATSLNNDADLAGTLTSAISEKVAKSGDTMTGSLNMGSNKMTNLGTPTSNTDASNKIYVDTTILDKISLHNQDTTSVHGIPDTSTIVFTGDPRLSDQRIPSDDSVSTVKVQDGAVTTAKIHDSSITTEKVVNSAITNLKIADNAVTNEKISSNAVTEIKIEDNSVTTTKIANSAVTTAKITDSNITTAKIADLNVITEKIANDAVTTDKVADLNVTTAKIANDAVTNAKIANDAVTTAKILDDSVTTDKILDDSVTTAKIVNDAVTTAKIVNDAVTTIKIADNAVTTAKILDDSVTTAKIVNDAVTNAKIADDAVTTAKIVNDAVTTIKIADNAVTTAKITDLNVTTNKIANDAVITDKIIDDAVTTAKIANDAVTTAKILDDSVTTIKILDNNITTAKINNSAITADKLATDSVTTGKIADGAVTSGKIADGTIVNADINSSAAIDQSKVANLTSDLALKAPLDGPTFTGTVVLPSTTSIGNVSATELGYVDGVTSAIQTQLDAKLASSTAASTYAPIASPTFTGTVSGVSKSMVGLGNVDNTSDADKPVSTATQTALDAKLSLAGGTMTGDLTLAGAPTQDAHAATKAYVDNVSAGINFHQPVRVATTGNITLSGTQTIDGVSVVAGDRVLVKDQTDQKTNGIYVVASGSWTRATDADNTPSGELAGGDFSLVLEGTVNSGYGYVCSNTSAITIGTTNITYAAFNAAKAVTAGTGLTETTPGTLAVDSSTVQYRVSGVSDTEIGYLDGVTSAIQTQLDAKAPNANPTFTGTVTVAASGVAFTDGTQTKAGVPSLTTIGTTIGAAYNLSTGGLALRDQLIPVSGTYAITVPANATTAYPVGTSISFYQSAGTGANFVEASGVTILRTPGLKLRTTYSSATLTKVASDTWLLAGDLSA